MGYLPSQLGREELVAGRSVPAVVCGLSSSLPFARRLCENQRAVPRKNLAGCREIRARHSPCGLAHRRLVMVPGCAGDEPGRANMTRLRASACPPPHSTIN